jgi:hypothetical protein
MHCPELMCRSRLGRAASTSAAATHVQCLNLHSLPDRAAACSASEKLAPSRKLACWDTGRDRTRRLNTRPSLHGFSQGCRETPMWTSLRGRDFGHGTQLRCLRKECTQGRADSETVQKPSQQWTTARARRVCSMLAPLRCKTGYRAAWDTIARACTLVSHGIGCVLASHGICVATHSLRVRPVVVANY